MEDEWPLQESERRFFSDCKSRAIQNAILPAAMLGVIAGRVLRNKGVAPPAVVAAGFGVAGALGSLFAWGQAQRCVGEFASAPNYPTAIALRSAIRAKSPSHPIVVRFDRTHPGYDDLQLRGGSVPAVSFSELALQRVLESDFESHLYQQEMSGPPEEIKRRQAKRDRFEAELEAKRAKAGAARQADASDSSTRSPSAAAAAASSSDGRPPSSFGWGDGGTVQRKMTVKRNQFGDEVIEEEEMKPE